MIRTLATVIIFSYLCGMENKDMKEVWKPVVGYEDSYEVSNLGNVRTIDRLDSRGWRRKGHNCTLVKRPDNRIVVSFCGGNKSRARLVHRVVAEAFIPNPNNLPFINHKDFNPSNNRVENLEWCTAKYNVNYSIDNILASIKKNICKPVIQLDMDGNEVGRFGSIEEASRATGICAANISGVVNKVTLINKNGKPTTRRTAGGYRWEAIQNG